MSNLEIFKKITIAGEGGLGKSTIVHRLVSNKFESNTKMTISPGIFLHSVIIPGYDFKLTYQIWDFAGEKRFRFIFPDCIKGSAAILLCYDLSSYITLKKLDEWYDLINSNINTNKKENFLIYLIGTKSDLKHAVKKKNIEDWVQNKKINRIFECSALSGHNILEIFDLLAKDLIEKIKNKRENSQRILLTKPPLIMK